MDIITNEEKIEEILNRGVEDVIVRDELKAALLSGKKLRIKFGIDPTGPKIHIGRAIPLRKLRAFQKLGHQIVIIIGDFTAQIGDASDKTEKRPMLTRMQIDENLKDYKSQLGKIIDLEKTEFVYNSEWLSKLNFAEVTRLAECFTVQQMLARRNFKDRYDAGTEISLREFLYPIMQGYDSVAVKADVEIGGFDQLFNLKAGRVMQEFFDMPKQNIITFQMLEGTDGRKMSTSWGNIITIVDEPNDMYGKVMSVKDELMIKYFTLCTDESIEKIKEIEQSLKNGGNPRDIKMDLARQIVTLYHGEKEAQLAERNFVETFQKGGIPDNIDQIITNKEVELAQALLDNKIIESKSEWTRLVRDKAVKDSEGNIIEDIKIKAYNVTLKIGKKKFVKVLAE